jgi:hypothetical protein
MGTAWSCRTQIGEQLISVPRRKSGYHFQELGDGCGGGGREPPESG